MNNQNELTEKEYLKDLKSERILYAWCLKTYGEYDLERANKEADSLYKYEPPEETGRELILHDLAWHHAMLKIHGNLYWLESPELEKPSEEYNCKSLEIDGA